MPRHARRLALTVALAGLGFVALVQPANAFFGSFATSCGGYGAHDQDGWLRCGT